MMQLKLYVRNDRIFFIYIFFKNEKVVYSATVGTLIFKVANMKTHCWE